MIFHVRSERKLGKKSITKKTRGKHQKRERFNKNIEIGNRKKHINRGRRNAIGERKEMYFCAA